MRRKAGLSLASAVVATLLVPHVVTAHGIGGTYQLPVPLWLYLLGAALAVAATFAVAARFTRPDALGAYATEPIGAGIAAASRTALRATGLLWWYGAIVIAFVVGDISPLPGVLLWIGIWVGLPIVGVVLGNPWPSMSPFRTTFAALDGLARRLGAGRLDAGVRYPSALARWPAVVLLAVGIWAELILPGRDVAFTVGLLMVGYTMLTLAGMLVFGQVAWLRNAELFEVELGWFGRIGPIGRRSVSRVLCDDCAEGCSIERCIDCPECSVAADDAEREPVRRPWIVGLTDAAEPGASDATFIVLLLAGVTYDGLRETAFGASLIGSLLPTITGALGVTLAAILLIDTIVLALVALAFALAFWLVLLLTRWLSAGEQTRTGATSGAYAATLLPIAAGYLIAHYLTLVIQGAVWLPALVVDPLMALAPALDWIPVSAIWYLSVAAIVGGHVAGVVLAHRLALREPGRAAITGIPMVALMVGYTVLSLWIIAQPIVVEPGLPAAAGP